MAKTRRQKNCDICGNLFPVDTTSTKYCPECRETLLGQIAYIKANQINRVSHCMICRMPLYRSRTRYTCSNPRCRRIYGAMVSLYSKIIKVREIEPTGLPVGVVRMGEKADPTPDDEHCADWLGISIEQYMQMKPRATRLDYLTLRARKLKMSYGEYMWRCGAYDLWLMETGQTECDESDTEKVLRLFWREQQGGQPMRDCRVPFIPLSVRDEPRQSGETNGEERGTDKDCACAEGGRTR